MYGSHSNYQGVDHIHREGNVLTDPFEMIVKPHDAHFPEAVVYFVWPGWAMVADLSTPIYDSIYGSCEYEMVWTNEVGTIPVCKVHGNNSKWGQEHGPNRPCITLDPW